ncbi:hypothetical protein J1614_005189 [Plenodomus biglobosus]|nr:hypothetical protein J1614_005189 [Plenodomus biglobosus]
MDMKAPTFDLTTTEGLRAYLIAQGQSNDVEIVLLSGGSANYVYRATGANGSAKVYKHAAPYSHSNKDFALDVRRMDYEARILEILSTTSSKTASLQEADESTVHAVPLISYDADQKLLCIGDGGHRNLKAAYEDPQLDITDIGQRLAQWLAEVHINSKNTSLAESSQTDVTEHCGNNPVALQLYRYSYNSLHIALSEFGHDAEIGVRINKEFGSLTASDNECVCHGDFWPGNILIRAGSAQGAAVELTVVDWELVRRGTSATDVGQFAAEAFLHDRFKGGRGLLTAFFNSYVNVRGGSVDRTWVKRMIVHWAVHVTYWPTRVEWTDRQGTQKLVDMGVAVLEAVLNDTHGNWETLVELPMLQDVKDTLRSLIA